MAVKMFRCNECHNKFFYESEDTECCGDKELKCESCGSNEVEDLGLSPEDAAMLLSAINALQRPLTKGGCG